MNTPDYATDRQLGILIAVAHPMFRELEETAGELEDLARLLERLGSSGALDRCRKRAASIRKLLARATGC